MSDPNFVIVHCPKGHELQAAREHLTATLACPVCGIEFVPQATSGAALPATPPADYPSTLGYAGTELLREPVEFPAITPWMIWLWLAVGIVQFIQAAVMATLGPKPGQDPTQMAPGAMGITAIVAIVGCFAGAALLTALVLQFVWIYRIHKDAMRARGYNNISPGLALGLSFVPVIHSIWTAWTLKKLSSFAVETSSKQGDGDTRALERSESATRNYFLIAIVLLLSGCGMMVYVMSIMWGPMMAIINSGGAGNQVQLQQQLQAEIANSMPVWLQIAMQGLSLLGIFLFFNAVRRLEAALYPALGAPPR